MDRSWKAEQHFPQPIELHDRGRQLQPDINRSGQEGHAIAKAGARERLHLRLGAGVPSDPVELGAPQGGPSDNDVIIHSLDMKAGLDPPQVLPLVDSWAR